MGGKRALGPHQACAQRFASQLRDDAQTLEVKHGLGGSVPPSAEQLRAAMRAVRHKVLRLVQLRAAAPVVIADCALDDAAEYGQPHAVGDGADEEAELRVVMPKALFQRACGGGKRFVVFGPWLETSHGSGVLFVSHAEALPFMALRAS